MIDRFPAMRSSFSIFAAAALTLLIALPAAAQDWHPIGPAKDDKDWILLKSGEWLRGNMDLFRDMKVEFDSDELDDLLIDWDDISGFRLPRKMTFLFEGRRVYTGSSSMRDGMIRINSGDGSVEMPRSELLSIIEGEPRERNFWSLKLNLGYTQRTGNTDQNDVFGLLDVKREATRSRLKILMRQDYRKVEDEETVDNQKYDLQLDLFLSRRFFITVIGYEFYSDRFQNIDYQHTAGAGAGYYIFRESRIDWRISLGGAYQTTRYLSVEAGEETSKESGSITTAVNLDWDITGDIEWQLGQSSRVGVRDLKNSTYHAVSTLSLDIYRDIFELTFSVTWDRVNDPQPFEDGTIPEKDDIKVIFGFGIDL